MLELKIAVRIALEMCKWSIMKTSVNYKIVFGIMYKKKFIISEHLKEKKLFYRVFNSEINYLKVH